MRCEKSADHAEEHRGQRGRTTWSRRAGTAGEKGGASNAGRGGRRAEESGELGVRSLPAPPSSRQPQLAAASSPLSCAARQRDHASGSAQAPLEPRVPPSPRRHAARRRSGPSGRPLLAHQVGPAPRGPWRPWQARPAAPCTSSLGSLRSRALSSLRAARHFLAVHGQAQRPPAAGRGDSRYGGGSLRLTDRSGGGR